MKKYIYSFLLIFLVGNLNAVRRGSPKVGIAANGDGVGIFQDSFDDQIRSSVYTGGVWAVPTVISGAGISSFPNLAFDVTSGFAVAVWVNIDPINAMYVLFGSVFSPITGLWTLPFAITNNTVNVDPESIHMSINHHNGTNSALATWRQFNGGDQEIGVASGTIGAGWTAALILS